MESSKEILPKHLGGHGNVNHVDEGALRIIVEDHPEIKSMLDIGCGLGEMKYVCDKFDISYTGIDGDYTAKRSHDQVIIHDYTKGFSPLPLDKTFDLGWSTEFVEHVEEKYIPKYMADFAKCKRVLITYAPPGKRGYHHVNCKNEEYWKNVFKDWFFVSSSYVGFIQKYSTMKRNFIRDNSLYFVNQNFSEDIVK